MEYIIIGLCVVAAIAVGVIIYLKSKQNKEEPVNNAVVASKASSAELQTTQDANELVIQMDFLPAEALPDDTKLVEITDSKVLAHVNNLVPGLAQAGNAVNNAVQVAQANGEVLYRAIIPAGAKLTDSKAMEGAVRGLYHGADGIGHANLVAVEVQKGTAVVANTAAAAMGVACFTHWFKRSCLKAFSSAGFCCADSQAACTLSMPTVIPREGLRSLFCSFPVLEFHWYLNWLYKVYRRCFRNKFDRYMPAQDYR